jgi:hypothetical protein
MGQVPHEAQRLLILPQPGEAPCSSLKRSPRRAAAQPARRHRQRRRLWTRRWALLSLLSPLNSHARTHVSKAGLLHARHGARRDIKARRAFISTVRPQPWRAGVRPARVQAHAPLHKHILGTMAGSARHGTRRGTPVRGAPPVARPRPRRAWVRPAGSAHTNTCNGKPTARRPGHSEASQAPAAARPEARRGGKGEPAHRAGGAMRVRRGARRRGVGCSPALPADVFPNPKLAKALGRRGLG